VQAAFTEEPSRRLGRGEVDPSRLADVLSNLRYAMPMNVQPPAAAAHLVARFMALTGEPDAYERYNTALGTVTADDVARVARTWLVPSRRNLVTLTPASAAERAPAGALRVGPSAAPAAPPPAAPTAAPTAAPARPSAARPASPRRPR
jgi:predicted Zn-dependent peptidase